MQMLVDLPALSNPYLQLFSRMCDILLTRKRFKVKTEKGRGREKEVDEVWEIGLKTGAIEKIQRFSVGSLLVGAGVIEGHKEFVGGRVFNIKKLT